MAAVVLATKIEASELAGKVIVHSSGTGDWHVGDRMDHRAADTLTAAGYLPDHHRAQHFERAWFADHDVFVAMDRSNLRDVSRMAPDRDRDRVVLFREFDPDARGEFEVPDPWYGGQDGFDVVLAIVERTTDHLLDELRTLLAPS
jgi:protein-tyrosine phosphatase